MVELQLEMTMESPQVVDLVELLIQFRAIGFPKHWMFVFLETEFVLLLLGTALRLNICRMDLIRLCRVKGLSLHWLFCEARLTLIRKTSQKD